MAGRYQRINADGDDETETRVSSLPSQVQPIPNSPPPSFRSRTSSVASRRVPQHNVDSALADAFGEEDDESDDEGDDRQRLMRTGPSSTPNDATPPSNHDRTPAPSHTTRRPPTQPPSSGRSQQQPPSSRTYGGGVHQDGVFSNITARPEVQEEKDEMPPTYEQAAADAAPPYWETTILAPGLGGPDEVFIDGMPVGSFFSFVWNGMISMSFQLVGFLLTYLLHSTHAAKNGSRAGLGITLIQYGFYMRSTDAGSEGSGAGGMMKSGNGGGYATPPDPNAHDFDPSTVNNGGGGDGGGMSISDIASSEWVAYVLMVIGWFILIRAVSDYLKARRHEQLVLQSPDRGLPVPIIAEGEASETVV